MLPASGARLLCLRGDDSVPVAETAYQEVEMQPPSRRGDETPPVGGAAEMKRLDGAEPCHEITAPCVATSWSSELEDSVDIPDPVGELQQSIIPDMAPAQPLAEESIFVAVDFVMDGQEPSPDADSGGLVEASLVGDLLAFSPGNGKGGGCSISDASGMEVRADGDVVVPLLGSVNDQIGRAHV